MSGRGGERSKKSRNVASPSSNLLSAPASPQSNQNQSFPANTVYTVGSSSKYVLDVQIMLNSTKCPIAKSTPGAIGYETVNFGVSMEQAIKCYQRAHGMQVTGSLDSDLYDALYLEYLNLVSRIIALVKKIIAIHLSILN